jgi:predicted ArsR family transcriptional regulator
MTHAQRITEALADGPLTISQVAERLSMRGNAVWNVMLKLEARRAVCRAGSVKKAGPGSPAYLWRLA